MTGLSGGSVDGQPIAILLQQRLADTLYFQQLIHRHERTVALAIGDDCIGLGGTDAKKVTLETKDGDKTFKYTGESKIVGGKGDMTFDKMAEFMAKAKEKSKDAPEGGKGKGGRGGLGVTVITNGEGDKETITEVKMAARAKKKDSN